MAKCKGCGVELLEGTVFCPYCGAQVEKEESKDVEVVEVVEINDTQEYTGVDIPKQESKAFKVFATLGMVFGFVSIGFGLLSLMASANPESAYSISAVGCDFAIPGFVFSIIGKKSQTHRGKAVFGFIANLICMILLFILTVAFLVIAIMEEGSFDPSYGVYY